ncbi:MAG TPA: hypothetical protein VMU22_12000, partial [Rhizomicrobium sp.]|nr:hypothetical protein [Rhizomicrobium sp.]
RLSYLPQHDIFDMVVVFDQNCFHDCLLSQPTYAVAAMEFSVRPFPILRLGKRGRELHIMGLTI